MRKKRCFQRNSASSKKKYHLYGCAGKQELGEVARMEAEEKDLTERCERGSREIGQLRSAIEGLKGVKKGKEEIFRQMKSYGEGRKTSPNPYKQLITMLKSSKETEHVMENFFPGEMEYHVADGARPVQPLHHRQGIWRQLCLLFKKRHVRAPRRRGGREAHAGGKPARGIHQDKRRRGGSLPVRATSSSIQGALSEKSRTEAHCRSGNSGKR